MWIHDRLGLLPFFLLLLLSTYVDVNLSGATVALEHAIDASTLSQVVQEKYLHLFQFCVGGSWLATSTSARICGVYAADKSYLYYFSRQINDIIFTLTMNNEYR